MVGHAIAAMAPTPNMNYKHEGVNVTDVRPSESTYTWKQIARDW